MLAATRAERLQEGRAAGSVFEGNQLGTMGLVCFLDLGGTQPQKLQENHMS